MWQDMVLYWAWRGGTPKDGLPPTPTKKRIEYAEIIGPGRYLNGPNQGEPIRMSLVVTVFDDDAPKEVNRDELEWHRNHGAEILMPSNK
jgi:hypothetical protein